MLTNVKSRQGVAAWLVMLVIGLAGGIVPASADERMDRASDCFQTNGGPQACPMVFGWCSAVWNYDRRQHCSAALYEDWDRVLNAQWADLNAVVQGRNLVDALDDQTPVWDRLVAEQRVWITWRDARCDWQMPVPQYDIRSSEEARFQCLTHMTRARAQQLWDMSDYLQTAVAP